MISAFSIKNSFRRFKLTALTRKPWSVSSMQRILPMHRLIARLPSPRYAGSIFNVINPHTCQSRASSQHAWRSQSMFVYRASSGSRVGDVQTGVGAIARAVQAAELACVLAAIVLQTKASMSSSSTSSLQHHRKETGLTAPVAALSEQQNLSMQQQQPTMVSTPAAHSHAPGILLGIGLLCNISLRSMTPR
jgi:hypothetical protein